MKVTCFVIAMFICASGSSQEVQFNADSASYTISDTNLTGAKSDLHRKAQGWVITKFKDPKKAIRLDDMDTGELTGTGTMPLKNSEVCTFTFAVSSRDRGFVGRIFDVGHYSAADTAVKKMATTPADNQSKQRAAKVDEGLRALLKDLHLRMKSDKDFSTPSPAPLD